MSYSRKIETAQKKQHRIEVSAKNESAKKTPIYMLKNEKKFKKYKIRNLDSYYDERL